MHFSVGFLDCVCGRWEREHQLPASAAPLVREFLASRAGDADDTDSDSDEADDTDANSDEVAPAVAPAAASAPALAVAPAPTRAFARALGKRKAVENPNPGRSLRSRR